MYCCMSIIVGWKNTFFVKFFCKKTIWRQRRSVCGRQPVFVSIRAPPWCEAYLGTTIQPRGKLYKILGYWNFEVLNQPMIDP